MDTVMELNKAIQEMSIADDKPLVLPNQAKFCSTEKNHCSIMGRFLNPSNQRMSNWILDMPRIWRLNNRVRGVALSQERFQFIFKSEDDLVEILKTGVWTQDDWCVVMEKWIEKPPVDYLMFLPTWIRLRNIPVNYYTEETIKEIAKCAGEVLQVLFDPEKSQAQDYVRVNVLLDVRNPLRNSKELQLPDGEIVLISFDYERIRKRCFQCQRLTHEKNMCPFHKIEEKNHSSSLPTITEKNKGLLLPASEQPQPSHALPKLLADAMKEATPSKQLVSQGNKDLAIFPGFSASDFYKDFNEGFSEAGSSGLSMRQKNPRKRKPSVQKTKTDLAEEAQLGSDHRPVLVKFIKDQELFRGQFRFDKRMADNPLLRNAIHSSWNSEISKGKHSSIFSIAECRRVIHEWKKSTDYNAKSRIQRLRKELDMQLSLKFPCWDRIKVIKEQLSVAFHEEEIFWRQKSSEKWLLDGDKNTSYFHATVKSKRIRNALNVLLDENGIEHTLNREKGQIASAFFEKLFKSSSPCSVNALLAGFQPRVSASMNAALIKEVTEQEIYKAVFSIDSESAPGPDGFTALFFKKYWTVVKDQVISEVTGFFKTGIIPEEWNHTHLCLIPKIPNPNKMTDVRPISLCSVLYKIVSKIISARLKVFLPLIVSPTQSAYVEERSVSDNILIAHEIMHSLRTNEKMSKDFMAFKTDMSKAFDRVEWSFLEGILIALGFDKKWISWIMGCVTSVTYSVLINGQPYGFIKPERGIRQGDPLSPFLFVLCTEALIHLLNQAKQEGKVVGIQFNNAGPSINHLLFADDTLLMCKASKEECEEILLCLAKYEKLSGQMINLDKSAITFGANVQSDIKKWIQLKSGIKVEGGTGKYLGLPECLSGSKQKLLGFIKDKLQARMTGERDWTTKIVDKAFEDGHQWWTAQNNGTQMPGSQEFLEQRWIAPQIGDLKCNIGFAWSRKKELSGAAWVVRDSSGKVLLHSRRAYTQNVTFAASCFEIIQALNKPKDWPAIIGHIAELLSFTNDKPNWFVIMEQPRANRGAYEIANSVLTGFRMQSYVARGHPQWLTYADAVSRNRLSLIARPLNPRVQDLQTVVSSLPRSWGLASRVHGRVLDGTYVQFLFQSEVDLLSIQRREPWVFNNWFVAFQRWEDIPDIDFLTTIDLWVQFRGIPLPYVSNETVRIIANRLGEFVETDFDEATSTQIAFIRVRIRFELTDRLRFFGRLRSRSGVVATIRFQYERLRRLCSNCFRMTHHREYCPFIDPETSERRRQIRADLNDELHRSALNSQSQISDKSFPAPISPPPRVSRPPPNIEELEAAIPYFQTTNLECVPIPQYNSSKKKSSKGSNCTPSLDTEVNSPISSKFEIGECSKRKRDKKDGGFQIPPKKR
ncbi:Reverse transcriptase domain [Arabidopsis thaliana x Arabidopsis arenosa]|uniref:Reverse transcriptase domain n=1 Tax=Arabidopsis thaliana x Arabidopsis arenosa TaxID=1240361 RepID=A0A8T2A776_9BRAS|nr:Reverse transcriptase domain [Arabidopsis thaliana x Arabidopsis arenosa]